MGINGVLVWQTSREWDIKRYTDLDFSFGLAGVREMVSIFIRLLGFVRGYISGSLSAWHIFDPYSRSETRDWILWLFSTLYIIAGLVFVLFR